jgi:hypothetical protein
MVVYFMMHTSYEYVGTFSTTEIRTDKGTGVLKFSEMEIDTEAAKNLYQKGVRRLRRRYICIYMY